MSTSNTRLSRRTALAWLSALGAAAAGVARASPMDAYQAPGHWVDDHARPFRLESLHGRPAIVTMAYGACRRVCSTSLRVMERIQGLCDARHLAVNFVVFGLDPMEDTPRDWADFRALRKLDRANWQFLTADEHAVSELAQRLGVHYWHYGEHVMHDFRILLMSPDGRIEHVMTAYDDDPAAMLPAH